MHSEPQATVRLSPEVRWSLVQRLNRTDRPPMPSMERRSVRVPLDEKRALISIERADGSLIRYVVLPRNLSRRGLAFLHGPFVHAKYRCELLLPALSGKWHVIAGRILRCRHVEGVVHEVSVGFDDPIDLQQFIQVGDEHLQRYRDELLADGVSYADVYGKATSQMHLPFAS